MLIATNDKKELITAAKELVRSENYYCPACRSPVHLKVGSVMRPHFAHYQNEACEVFSEGETAEHIQGKLQLKAWLEQQGLQVAMEAYLPQLKQRPDLLVTVEQRKVALEFQCSAIPIHKIVERTQGYQRAGYGVIWLLGENFAYQKQLTPFQKACLTNIEDTLVLFHYSVAKQRLEYRYDFQLRQNQKMTQTKKVLRSGGPLQLHLTQKRPTTHNQINIEMEHNKLLRQLQFPSVNGKRFLKTLYEMKESLVSMPKELYTMTAQEWIIQNHPYEWKLQFLLWLEEFPLKTVLTKKKLNKWMKSINYYQIPQLTEEQKLAPILQFMGVLMQSGVLRQIRFDKWVIDRYPKRFKYLEDKFKGKELASRRGWLECTKSE